MAWSAFPALALGPGGLATDANGGYCNSDYSRRLVGWLALSCSGSVLGGWFLYCGYDSGPADGPGTRAFTGTEISFLVARAGPCCVRPKCGSARMRGQAASIASA